MSGWKQAEIRETGTPESPYALDGFQPVFTAGDLGAIRAAATRPLRITTEAGVTTGTNLPPPVVNPPLAGPGAVNPLNMPSQFGGPSGLGSPGGQFEIAIRSTGGSTGPVLEGVIVNYGPSVSFTTTGLILEPVPPGEARQHDARWAEFLKTALARRNLSAGNAPKHAVIPLGAPRYAK